MKRIRLICIVVVVVVLGGMAVAIFREREPSYQGRTLSEWIMQGNSRKDALFRRNPQADFLHPETDPEWQVASHAVKQMAPDAIPILLRWVQVQDSASKERAIKWLNKYTPVHPQEAFVYFYNADLGFELLGKDAKPAWPDLIRLTYASDPKMRIGAFFCLTASKPGKEVLMPVLLRLIHDSDSNLQYQASQEFHEQFPQDAEAAGVYKMFPELKSYPID